MLRACVDGNIPAEPRVECRSCTGVSVFESGAIGVYEELVFSFLQVLYHSSVDSRGVLL